MSKIKVLAIITIIAVAFYALGVTLTGINIGYDSRFSIVPMATAIANVGLITGILSGIAFIALFIVHAVRDDNKR